MTWTRPLDAASVDDLVTQIARSPEAVQYLLTVEAVARELVTRGLNIEPMIGVHGVCVGLRFDGQVDSTALLRRLQRLFREHDELGETDGD